MKYIRIIFSKVLAKILSLKYRLMLAATNRRLNEKVAGTIQILRDFSVTKLIDERIENEFLDYLRFTNNGEFELGNRKFKFQFNNLPAYNVSFMTLYIIKPTSETLSGFKDIEIPRDFVKFEVNIGGGMILNGTQVQAHLVGISLFRTIHNYIMDSNLGL